MVDTIDDEYNDSHKMPIHGDYIEIAINPPIHLQGISDDSTTRKLRMLNYFQECLSKIAGTDDKIGFMEISISGLYHLHAILKVRDPHVVLNCLLNLKYHQVRAHYETLQRVMVYRIKDTKHLNERLEYISKDWSVTHNNIVKLNQHGYFRNYWDLKHPDNE